MKSILIIKTSFFFIVSETKTNGSSPYIKGEIEMTPQRFDIQMNEVRVLKSTRQKRKRKKRETYEDSNL